jgi:hypothetical protein
MMPQAPTMFAAAKPQVPTTAAARNTATANDRANDGPLNFLRRASAIVHRRLQLLHLP